MVEIFRDKIGNTEIAIRKDSDEEGYYIQLLYGAGSWFYCHGNNVVTWKTFDGIKRFIEKKKLEGML